MTEVKYDKSHHAGGTPEARIANRQKGSGDRRADVVAEHGSGPTRLKHYGWHSGHYVDPKTAAQPTEGLVNKRDASLVGGGGDGR
jgi:hypothetical protein